MISLKNIEHKFIELKLEVLTINEFEKWIYLNNEILENELSEKEYLDIISINYNSSHAKHELEKALKIDHQKLEKYQLLNVFNLILSKDKIGFKPTEYTFDLYRLNSIYKFKIQDFSFWLDIPFEITNLENFRNLSNIQRVELFDSFYPDKKKLLIRIHEIISNDKCKWIIPENMKQLTSLEQDQLIKADNNELILSIYIPQKSFQLKINKTLLSSNILEN